VKADADRLISVKESGGSWRNPAPALLAMDEDEATLERIGEGLPRPSSCLSFRRRS
jgi:hypothetical protein